MLSLENIDKEKLASEAIQETFEQIVFLTTNCWQIKKLDNYSDQKWVSGTYPFVPPLLKVGRGGGETRAAPRSPMPLRD